MVAGNPAEMMNILNQNRTAQNLNKPKESPGLGCKDFQYVELCEVEQLEREGSKLVAEDELEPELVAEEALAASLELVTHSGVNLEPRWRRHDPKPPWFLIQAQDISKWACTMVSEKDDEEESSKSLNETMLEQIKKMMIEEFDRREHVKEGKQKQPKDPVTSKKKPVEDLSGYMMMIPPFLGNNDPDVYLDWEKKCEITFNRHNIADINRVKLAAMAFKYYALSWWKQVETARAYSGAYEIST
ncbi:unnamed protein product [Microthlaspi erraticum]|uniref:Retrotransposon gag domain-containing protein n=1 Tax=Microthlaspi erraticum TaxID=1685480 RepID=A0A6D2L5P6_9BRAS|nr:unnamed protein product [Microthlaspi erraticum]